MKAIVKKTIKTRNGSRKTVSEELIGSRPISKKTTISNQRPDYAVKPISKDKRLEGQNTMNKLGETVKRVASEITTEKGITESLSRIKKSKPIEKKIGTMKSITKQSSVVKGKPKGR